MRNGMAVTGSFRLFWRYNHDLGNLSNPFTTPAVWAEYESYTPTRSWICSPRADFKKPNLICFAAPQEFFEVPYRFVAIPKLDLYDSLAEILNLTSLFLYQKHHDKKSLIKLGKTKALQYPVFLTAQLQ